MGTLVLIYIGDGTVAGIVLKRSFSYASGWVVMSSGWAFAILAGIFTANLCGSPDAHINTAVTLAFAIKNHNYSNLLPFAMAQFLGAFIGAVLVWLQYHPHWRDIEDTVAKRSIFCTRPAIRDYFWNLLSEFLITTVLIVVVGAISSKLVLSTGVAAGLSPLLISCVVWGLVCGTGGTTGIAINPARDLGPRCAHALLPIIGKGDSDWKYAPVPVFGPLLGGVVGGCFLRLLGA